MLYFVCLLKGCERVPDGGERFESTLLPNPANLGLCVSARIAPEHSVSYISDCPTSKLVDCASECNECFFNTMTTLRFKIFILAIFNFYFTVVIPEWMLGLGYY